MFLWLYVLCFHSTMRVNMLTRGCRPVFVYDSAMLAALASSGGSGGGELDAALLSQARLAAFVCCSAHL
jgi:hypothetical protein